MHLHSRVTYAPTDEDCEQLRDQCWRAFAMDAQKGHLNADTLWDHLSILAGMYMQVHIT